MTAENKKAGVVEKIIPQSLVIVPVSIPMVCEPGIEPCPPPPILQKGVDLRNEAKVLVNEKLGMVFAHKGVVYELLPLPNSPAYEGDGEVQRMASTISKFLWTERGRIAFLAGAMRSGKTRVKAGLAGSMLNRKERVLLLRASGARPLENCYSELAGQYPFLMEVEKFNDLSQLMARATASKAGLILIEEMGLVIAGQLRAGKNEKEVERDFKNKMAVLLAFNKRVVISLVDRFSFGQPWPPIHTMVKLAKTREEIGLWRLFPLCACCGQPAVISAVTRPYSWRVFFRGNRREWRVHQLVSPDEPYPVAVGNRYAPHCETCDKLARPGVYRRFAGGQLPAIF